MYYAYIYTHPVSYAHLYVGKGTRDRATAHMSPRGSENGLLRKEISDLRKVGMKPIVTKIQTSTEEFAFMLERGLIKLFGRKDLGKGTLCNFSDGGDGPVNLVRSEEAKRKTSETLKTFYKTHVRVQTKESIDKIKASKKAKPTGTGKWINNGVVQTKCKIEELQDKLNNGWALGTLKKHITEEYRNKLKASAYKQWQRQKGII